MQRRALPYGGVPCRAVPCCTVLCRTVPCCDLPRCAFSFGGASGLFSWSMELLAFVSRLFAPKMLGHLAHLRICDSVPFFHVSERSWRNRRHAKRLV